MKLAIGFLVLFSAPGLVSADIYKCTVNGKTVYSSARCATNAAVVPMLKEPSPEELEKEAEAARERQKQQDEAVNQTLQGRRERAEQRAKEAREAAERRARAEDEAQQEAIRQGVPYVVVPKGQEPVQEGRENP